MKNSIPRFVYRRIFVFYFLIKKKRLCFFSKINKTNVFDKKRFKSLPAMLLFIHDRQTDHARKEIVVAKHINIKLRLYQSYQGQLKSLIKSELSNCVVRDSKKTLIKSELSNCVVQDSKKTLIKSELSNCVVRDSKKKLS